MRCPIAGDSLPASVKKIANMRATPEMIALRTGHSNLGAFHRARHGRFNSYAPCDAHRVNCTRTNGVHFCRNDRAQIYSWHAPDFFHAILATLRTNGIWLASLKRALSLFARGKPVRTV